MTLLVPRWISALTSMPGDEAQSNRGQSDLSSTAAGVPVKPKTYATSNFISLRLASGTRFLTFRISTPTT